MKDALIALFSSRKFFLVLVVVALGAAFVFTGKLAVTEYTGFVTAIASVLIGSIAYEDGQSKSAGLSSRAGSVVVGLATRLDASDPPAPPAPPPLPLTKGPLLSIALPALALVGWTLTAITWLLACSPAANQMAWDVATTIDAIACKEAIATEAGPEWVTAVCPGSNGQRVAITMPRREWMRMTAPVRDAGPGL